MTELLECQPYTRSPVLGKARANDLGKQAIRERRLYRGCAWALYPNAELDAFARDSPSGVIGRLGYRILNADRQLTVAATRLVLECQHILTTEFCSLDKVPWEIHFIEDPIAYSTALSAYKREARK